MAAFTPAVSPAAAPAVSPQLVAETTLRFLLVLQHLAAHHWLMPAGASANDLLSLGQALDAVLQVARLPAAAPRRHASSPPGWFAAAVPAPRPCAEGFRPPLVPPRVGDSPQVTPQGKGTEGANKVTTRKRPPPGLDDSPQVFAPQVLPRARRRPAPLPAAGATAAAKARQRQTLQAPPLSAGPLRALPLRALQTCPQLVLQQQRPPPVPPLVAAAALERGACVVTPQGLGSIVLIDRGAAGTSPPLHVVKFSNGCVANYTAEELRAAAEEAAVNEEE